MKNQLIFGEYNLSDWGVYYGKKTLFNAPKRNVTTVSVPGRNGDLVIDNGNWENIDVVYSCFIEGKAKDRLADLKQAILSQLGYVKISDSVNPSEFRLGCYKEGLHSISTSLHTKNARFDLTFNCKPQRFLAAGDEWRAVQPSDRLYNPTLFPFSPLFKIKMSDAEWGSFTVDDYTIRVKDTHSAGTLYIDTETMQCYSGDQLLNDCVEFSSDLPLKVQPGGRLVTLSANIANLQVKTRWFRL